jgi:hypothetical protein
VEFRFRLPGGDRRHYVDESDVAVVLSRLPPELIGRIRVIHFSDNSRRNRRLGYTSTLGRREIALCALAPTVSLNAAIAGPETAPMFGAVRGAQWPALAVRRFMLYDVLLHEIGHLQIVDEGARTARRKFADEKLAQSFANEWREVLWSKRFAHADPVHNPPPAEEIAALSRWVEAHAEYKRGIGVDKKVAQRHFERALGLYPDHSLALIELSHCIVAEAIRTGAGARLVADARKRAVELLGRALLTDPTSFDGSLRMGWNCGHLGRYQEARRHIARALGHRRMSAVALSAIGDAHADWGFLVEAERLFQKALAAAPRNPKILLRYARAVWDLGAHTPEETSRALAVLKRALAAGPDEAAAHFHLARALATIPGEAAKALHHAERVLTLSPGDADGFELVTRLREPLQPGERAHLERPTLVSRTFDRATGDVVERR